MLGDWFAAVAAGFAGAVAPVTVSKVLHWGHWTWDPGCAEPTPKVAPHFRQAIFMEIS
jgi:hypothetical protein